MRLLVLFFICLILFQINIDAQLSSSSCALLHTANSFTTIIPEMAQLAMRFYRPSTSTPAQHRQKRFLTGGSSSGNVKGTVTEQMIANSIRDTNFTNVAILIFNNNDTMTKIRKNIDNEAIIRKILLEIDYEKVGIGLWSAIEKEFDLEHFVASVINRTHIDIIHEEFLTNGTLPVWLVKSIHPSLNVQTVQRMYRTLQNVTQKFVQVLSKSERFDHYIFNMITQQALNPLNHIIQGVKAEKPKTFNQLIEIIVNNINRVATEQFQTSTKRTPTKKSAKKSPTTPAVTVDLNDPEDVKLMLYHWSIAVDSMGQTSRVMMKSLEQLYCTSVWE